MMARDFLTMDMTKKSGDSEVIDLAIDLAIEVLKSSKHLSSDEKESLMDLERTQKDRKRVSKINSIFDNT